MNFACEGNTRGRAIYAITKKYIIKFLKVSIEVISLIWLGKLFQMLQACGPKENLYVLVLANGTDKLLRSDLVAKVDDVMMVGRVISVSVGHE